MKLTQKQKDVLQLMWEGYELGYDSFGERAWLQLGGCGYGGYAINLRANTFNSLIANNLVSVKAKGYPTTTYQLTNQ